MVKKFIMAKKSTQTKEEVIKEFAELGVEITPWFLWYDNDVYVQVSAKVTRVPDDDCEHVWLKTDYDDWSEWNCSKCQGRVTAKVYS